MQTFSAIDPVSLMLSGKAYQIYVEMKHPHVAAQEALATTFQRLSADEQRFAIANAARVGEFATAVQAAAKSVAKAA